MRAESAAFQSPVGTASDEDVIPREQVAREEETVEEKDAQTREMPDAVVRLDASNVELVQAALDDITRIRHQDEVEPKEDVSLLFRLGSLSRWRVATDVRT